MDPNAKPVPPIVASLIRTVVPLIVQVVIGQLAAKGIHAGAASEFIAQLVGGVIAALYYLAVRILETRFKAVWGWLLGLPKPPTYDATAKVDPASPTGESAAPASDVAPVNAPVETVPTDASGVPVAADPTDPPPPFQDATGPFPQEPDVAVDQTPYADEPAPGADAGGAAPTAQVP